MHSSRLAAAGIGLAVAGALVLTVSAPASAALLTPLSYPHQQWLADGALTVQVTNGTSKTASCWISVHDGANESQLNVRAAAVNTQLTAGVASPALDNARAQAAQGALHILADGISIASAASSSLAWPSGRTDTAYAIYQGCTTPDIATGLTINGLAQVYRVTGTGAAGRFANVSAAPTVSGTGRLGTSFTASYDATGVTPAPTSVTFAWYASDGTGVGTGATFTPSNAFLVTADLVGMSVYVVATAHAVGHVDEAVASTRTSLITAPVFGAASGTVRAGGTVTVQASGLLAGESYTVELHSDPVVLGTAVADGAGTIAATFRIPASIAPGRHTLVLLRNGVSVGTSPLTVAAQPTLAATGADAGPVGLAVTLLLSGAAALLASRVGSRREVGADITTS
ncbi:MAG: hypothetical protein EAS51_01620 [Microbacteriaceae bacterium]|nr:MAG: hypothetical protein EAS51_01620 [Microbacteriaceae bacterium]